MPNEISRSIVDLVDIVLVLKQAEGGKEPGDNFCSLSNSCRNVLEMMMKICWKFGI